MTENTTQPVQPVQFQPYTITVVADGHEVAAFDTSLPKGSGGEILVAVQDVCRAILARNGK